MRDPARIDTLLEIVRDAWKKHPDLRLCQLIGNCFDAGDLYYKEDHALGEALVRMYSEKAKEVDNDSRGH